MFNKYSYLGNTDVISTEYRSVQRHTERVLYKIDFLTALIANEKLIADKAIHSPMVDVISYAMTLGSRDFPCIPLDTGHRFVFDGAKWITVHPNGKDHEGRAVMLDDNNDIILGGIGGKYNGLPIAILAPSSQASKQSNATPLGAQTSANASSTAKPQSSAAKIASGNGNAKQKTKATQQTTASSKAKPKATTTTQTGGNSMAKLEPSKLSNAAYGAVNNTSRAISNQNYTPPKEDESLKRQLHLYKLAQSMDKPFPSVLGMVFDSKHEQEKFLKLERWVYKYWAALNEDAIYGTSKRFTYGDQEKAMAKVAEYLSLCRNWAVTKHKVMGDQVASIDTQARDFAKSIGYDWPTEQCSVCSLSGTHYVQNIGPDFRKFINAWTNSVNEIVNGQKQSPKRTTYKAMAVDYAKTKFLYDQLVNGFTNVKLSPQQTKSLAALKKECSQVCSTAKAILMAATGTNTYQAAIYAMASHVFVNSRPDLFDFSSQSNSIAGVTANAAKKMSFKEADGKAPNPHYDSKLKLKHHGSETTYYPFQINCQTCGLALEARLRGFDVAAKPYIETSTAEYDVNNTSQQEKPAANACEKLAYSTITAWYNPLLKRLPVPVIHKSIKDAVNTVKFGERHMLMFNFGIKDNTLLGHIVNLISDDSGTFVYDPQSGQKYSLDKFVEAHTNVKGITTFRVDDCTLNFKVANQVLCPENTDIPKELRDLAVDTKLTEDFYMVKGDKEWFKAFIEKESRLNARYVAKLDGCLIFEMYPNVSPGAFVGEPIYAICDPDNPDEVPTEQGFEMYNRIREKYPDYDYGVVVDPD